MRKELWQLLRNQKSYSKSRNVSKMPKKFKIFRLKIQKGAGILKKPKIFLNKGIKNKKIIYGRSKLKK